MIYHQGEWGTICNTGFDGNDAQVACRQLNLTPDYAQYYGQHLRVGVTVWRHNMACTGTEHSILSCPRTTLSKVGSCGQDISVRCPGKWLVRKSICQYMLIIYTELYYGSKDHIFELAMHTLQLHKFYLCAFSSPHCRDGCGRKRRTYVVVSLIFSSSPALSPAPV